MVINENCKVCQIKRNIDKYPLNATGEIKEYQYKVKKIKTIWSMRKGWFILLITAEKL